MLVYNGEDRLITYEEIYFMVFSSLLFLFRFLPAVLVVYFLVPRRFRNLVLFLFSLLFYAWGEPVYIVLMLVSILVSYTGGIVVDRMKKSGRAGAAKDGAHRFQRHQSVSAWLFQIRGFCD